MVTKRQLNVPKFLLELDLGLNLAGLPSKRFGEHIS
jgi:hypothetical protein